MSSPGCPLHIISHQDALDFVNSKPDRDQVQRLERQELALVADVLNIQPDSCNVAPMVNLICDQLCGMSASKKSEISDSASQKTSDYNSEQAQRDHEFRMMKLKMNLAKIEADKEIKLKELEVHRANTVASQGADNIPGFRLQEVLKLVPQFDESSVSQFFERFEKIATGSAWPKEKWSTLVQTALKGKAIKAYDSLSFADSLVYLKLKTVVLRAYELRPEAYRQKYRNRRRHQQESYPDFNTALITNFDSWMRSEDVANDYESLRELVLLEDFLSKVETDVRTFLVDKNVTTSTEAAELAQDYYLARKQDKNKKKETSQTTPDNSNCNPSPKPNPVSKANSPAVSCNSPPKKTTQTHNEKPTRRPFFCTFCNKPGHTLGRCWFKPGAVRPLHFVSSRESRNVPVVTLESSPGADPVDNPSHKDVPFPGTGVRETADDLSPIAADGVVQAVSKHVTPDYTFAPYLSSGLVRVHGVVYPVNILRDTGASISLLVKPPQSDISGEEFVLIKGVTGVLTVPFVKCEVECDLFKGTTQLGIVDSLPEEGVDLILGNDLAKGEAFTTPVLSTVPVSDVHGVMDNDVFPLCAVTRSMSRLRDSRPEDVADRTRSEVVPQVSSEEPGNLESHDQFALGSTFMGSLENTPEVDLEGIDCEKLMAMQSEDPDVEKLKSLAVDSLDEEKGTCYYIKDDVLWRRWRPPNVNPSDGIWDYHQIVVPKGCRQQLLLLAHSTPFAGHMGVKKTLHRLRAEFYWPRMSSDVARFVRSCHTCQVVGSPNQTIPKSPLVPIPVFEAPFSKLIIDVVGPLPPTSSRNIYILTIMDTSTRYPEAIPLTNVKAKTIVKVLLEFFTKFGLPREVQSDQGSNFMSNVFQQALLTLGIVHITSSAYHPESQGALERYHQTLKTMLRKYCMEHTKDWDKGLPFLLFATREVPQESLGFSPNELVFAHRVRGPLGVLKDSWSSGPEESRNLLSYVLEFKTRLKDAQEMAQQNLKSAQGKMKTWYDRKARQREFNVGEEVLALLPLQGQPLSAKFCGPYYVDRRIGDTDYLLRTPDRRKKHQLCHVNMLKPYHRSENSSTSTPTLHAVAAVTTAVEEDIDVECEYWDCRWPENTEVLSTLKEKLSHLPSNQVFQLLSLTSKHPEVFKNVPGRTSWTEHDVCVGDAAPIKLSPYRVSPRHTEALGTELDYMLELGIISPCVSPWSSPVTLQPKSDGGIRFCIGYRRVNAITTTDTYPLPRLEDCVDRIGSSRYITKLDLKQGFWQVPLTERAKDISCFVVDGQTYKCHVMPYGMKNAPATFQRLMNKVVNGMKNCVVYFDDVVVYTQDWESHLQELGTLLSRLSAAGLVVNLKKCEFVSAQVQYLGYVVGHGKVQPPDSKVEAIKSFHSPRNRRELRRFLGCIGYYRCFLRNFATLVTPLTELLRKDRTFKWNEKCEESFVLAKQTLCNFPVMLAPNFSKPFSLAVDASNVGAGAVLLQEDDEGIEHPVCYFSKKFSGAQKNYSVIEKELLSLILALQHFSVYIPPFGFEVRVYTDHHPLKYLNSLKTKNQRLTRWALFLQQFNLSINHIKGTDNIFADCLSRA